MLFVLQAPVSNKPFFSFLIPILSASMWTVVSSVVCGPAIGKVTDRRLPSELFTTL